MSSKKEADERIKAGIVRTGELNNWLIKVNANLLWKLNSIPNTKIQLFCYAINGQIALIQWIDNTSWCIFTQPTTSTKIDETFRAAELSLGLVNQNENL